jgi:hypothetical protein
MSRGLGAIQRHILDQLATNTADHTEDRPGDASWTFLVDLVGENATRAQVESARRAMRSLERAGLVKVSHGDRKVPCSTSLMWDGTARRAHMKVRLAAAPEIEEEWARRAEVRWAAVMRSFGVTDTG